MRRSGWGEDTVVPTVGMSRAVLSAYAISNLPGDTECKGVLVLVDEISSAYEVLTGYSQ